MSKTIMCKLLLRLIALAALSGAIVFAQDITGTWQGTLQVGNRHLRNVYKIVKGDGTALKGTMYSIDQAGLAIPVTAITLQNSVVKMTIPGVGGTYEGKLDSDGVNLAGTWTQGGTPLPLNLKLVKGEEAWAIPEPVRRMPADAKPGVEVATIKLSKPDTQGKGYTFRGTEVITINTSLSDLISFAYGLHARQIANASEWMETDHYDVVIKADVPGQPNVDQFKILIQKVIDERFALKFHGDKKEQTVYAITVSKTGLKITKNDGDPNGPPGLGFRGLGKMAVHNATLVQFAETMQSSVLNRPVVDQTGLAGKYDFTLDWTPDETQFAGLGVKPPPPSDKDTAPDLFTAIQQQTGLKLDSAKASVDVLVIDHVEKPSAN